MQQVRRILLVVAYDGTAYCGWQVQPNGDTIEAQLNRHLSELLDEPVHVMGASRTDSGVHSRGNVAVFDMHARMPAEKIALAMNTRLPSDIKVVSSREVPLTFHPRYQQVIKTYEYRIYNNTIPDPCQRLYSLFYYWHLDERKMQQAADVLVGTHDFSSFCTHKPEITDHVRTIYSIRVIREEHLVRILIRGNGFLYNMVRIIVGTLLRIGTGMVPVSAMQEILDAKDRNAACETARPEGLTLLKIEYPNAGF